MTRQFTAYTKDYQEKCFTTWYSSNRPTLAVLHDSLPVDEHGRIPDVKLIRRWRNELGWDMRADELDVRAIELVSTDLVNDKANMLRRHAHMGFMLQEAGMAHLISGSFDSSSAAVSAVIRGAELERESRGIGELIVKMSKMSDEDINKEIMSRLARASDAGQVIDAEEDAGELDNTDTNQ